MPLHPIMSEVPRLRRGSKHAEGLVFAIVPRPDGSLVDLVQRARILPPGSATIVRKSVYGIAARDWAIPLSEIGDLQFTTGPHTFVAAPYIVSVPGNSEYVNVLAHLAYVNETNNQGWGLQVRPPNDGFPGWGYESFRNNATAGLPGTSSTNTGVTVGDHSVVCSSDGSLSRTLFLDGLEKFSQAGNVSPLYAATGLFNSSTAAGKVPVLYVLGYKRTMVLNECKEIVFGGGIDLLNARRSWLGWAPGLGGTVAPSTFTFAATLDAVALSAGFTTAIPPPSTFTFVATAGPMALSAGFTALPPAPSTFTFAATAGPVALSAGFTAATPAPATFAVGSTLGAVTLVSTFTTAGPAAATFVVAATLGAVALASTFTTAVPAATTFAVGATLGPIAAAITFHSTVVHAGAGTCRIIFHCQGRIKVPEVVFDEHYLGRMQRGDAVPLRVVVKNSKGAPVAPVRAPVASLYNLDTQTHVLDVQVPRLRGGRSPAVFAGTVRVAGGLAPGRYAVVYRYLVGITAGLEAGTFEVAAGGDGLGPVVAGQFVAVPSADAVVVQTGAGVLAVGRRPRG